jgi:hypothetical protein
VSQFDRPGKAAALLRDPIFIEAFELEERAIVEAWRSCPLRDKEGAHELRVMLQLLGKVRSNVEHAAREGKAAQHRLKQPTYLGDLWNKATQR